MSPAASSAYVVELRQQIAILSERCALLAAELAAAREALRPPPVEPRPDRPAPRPSGGAFLYPKGPHP
ncbi:MAG TPA: hypothetical protein DHV56_13605 [Rhodobacter sp.]|nr:hypothetical protein [Rhodobacter sp.]